MAVEFLNLTGKGTRKATPLLVKVVAVVLCVICDGFAFGQSDSAGIFAFTKGYELLSIAGPGWEAADAATAVNAKDLVVELVWKGEGDLEAEQADFEKLLILTRGTKEGGYRLLAENEGLLMTAAMMGAGGSGAVNLIDSVLYVDYRLGSNSSLSQVAMTFKKASSGKYLFDSYKIVTTRYGKPDPENSFFIRADSMRPVEFSEATEAVILKLYGY